MRQLIITNVGPITQTAKIEYERFCILIGPQSNGKSTIAKILSTCMWLEKEACTTLTTDVVKDGAAFKQLVEDFHRMHNYIHPDSSIIKYISPFVSIEYNKGDFSISFKNNLSYERLKITYVPSDRNVVTMKDIEKRDLDPTNFRSFLFDWLETNRNYDSTHKATILNLGIKYYFNAEAKERMDMLTHENGVTYNIPLYDASSGMQSLVPMNVLMHYLVTDYFTNYGKGVSFEQQQKNIRLAWEIARVITTKHYPDEVTKKDYKTVYNELIRSKADGGDTEASELVGEMTKLFKRLSTPQSISFILEEPEQNLFPLTQVDLFNDIVDISNSKHQSSVFITTHSPYLLAAANIQLFMGKMVEEGVDTHQIQELTGLNTIIKKGEFTAYSVAEGTCQPIIDGQTGLIKQNELDTASDYNAEVFGRLYQLYIKNMKKDDSDLPK